MIDKFDNIDNYNPLGSNIIFSFLQDIESGTFTNTTSWGLEMRNKIEDVKTSRWAIVNRVGPEVPKHIKVGTYILIEQLMWTEGFKVNEAKKWTTNYSKLLAHSEKEPVGIF